MSLFSDMNFRVRDFGKVAVLLGGSSAEREISLLSGNAIYAALKKAGVDVVKIDTQDNIYQQIVSLKIERAFIALHGRDGEDGVIQGFLKLMQIPFTGSSTAGSALAMNKLHSKQVWQQNGYQTASFKTVLRNKKMMLADAENTLDEIGPVLFVKPIREGSSVGMSKVSTAKALVDAVDLAQQYDDVLIESYIDGREYTVSILDGKALPSISMVTPNEFYDYDAKYCSSQTEYFCPSGLSDEQEAILGQLAVDAFECLGCSGWGRVDFIRQGNSDSFMLLEANTVPGMTESSLVPKSAQSVGLSFTDLVLRILASSLDSESTNGDSYHG